MDWFKKSALMKWILRIALFVSVIFVLWISRELYLWYVYFNAMSVWLGWAYIAVALAATIYFLVLPVVNIFMLPSFGEPETSEDPVKQKRSLLRRGKMLKIHPSEMQGKSIEEMNERLQRKLKQCADDVIKIRDRYVLTAAIGTAASQSAVVDLYVVLSCCLKVMLKTLKAYGGRTSVKDSLQLMQDIVISGALGASEFAEIGGNVFAELGAKSFTKIPVANMVLESAADGLVNAYLVCRVAMITENYCTVAYAGEGKHWQPTLKATVGTTRSILIGSYDLIKEKLGPAVGMAFSFLLKFGKKYEPEVAQDLNTTIPNGYHIY